MKTWVYEMAVCHPAQSLPTKKYKLVTDNVVFLA